MRRFLIFGLALAMLVAISPAALAQIVVGTPTTIPAETIRPIQLNKIYDYWQTSGNTNVTIDLPADFFGSGSDAATYVIECTGTPFGPGAGPGHSANADTSIYRKRDPKPQGIGNSDTVSIKMHGLSLDSVSPITVTYNGGTSSDLWDVHVGLSTAAAQPWGSLTATKTYSGGGTFDSSLTVIPKFTFTRVSNGTIYHLDVGVASWGIPVSTIQATTTHYVTSLPGFSGAFHPGYSQGPTPEQINYYEFSNNCAEHETEPCGEDCPDEGGVEIEPVELEGQGL